MKPDWNDDEIKALFQRQRRAKAEKAPSFDALLRRRERSLAGQFALRSPFRLAAACLAIAGIAAAILLASRNLKEVQLGTQQAHLPGGEAVIQDDLLEKAVMVSHWQAPSDVLLSPDWNSSLEFNLQF